MTRTILAATCVVISLARSAIAAEPTIGQPAPTFNVTGPGGKEYKLADYAGKKNVVVLFSRAHW